MPAPSFAIFALTYYLLAGLGVNLGFHRMLTHGSLRLPKWFEHTIVAVGLPAGTPIQWVANHRYHHRHTDTTLDPHSPVHQGFWYAHVGWYLGSKNTLLCVLYALAGPVRMLVDAWMRPRTNREYDYLAPDIASDPWYQKLSRPWPYALAMHLHAGIPLAITGWFWGWGGIVGFWLTLVALYNLGDGIDSVAHLYGDALPGQLDSSRNSFIMGILVLGEGWHANHHQFPWSARHGLRPWEFDWTWQVIRALQAVGLAHDVHVPTATALAQSIGGPR
jgi:fatty-acid desaturase